ncbi:MAG: NAD-dependent epimerase/dehydratase family protein [Candidatus Riflebacteria bacterium]|nr:NAD-dependent epimerase/dehydratase family protein [Candidatus Riflebacteria bacterium]
MKVLVTGGGGFLGKAIATKLRERGLAIRSFSRGTYPELQKLGIETVSGDITDAAAVEKACSGCDIVFHVAAKPGVWGPYEDYHRANYIGTEKVVEACKKLKIGRLVYTSSPSVVFDGKNMENGNESVPYPDHYEAHYPKTKAMAERLVLSSNGPTLSTVSIRPHLIWGPGDNHLVPRLVAAARQGNLKFVGNGMNRIDTIYVDNAADAHILAGERLAPGAACAGKAYFVSNGDPRPISEIVNGIIRAAGLPPIPLCATISPTAAWFIGGLLEMGYKLFNLSGEPRITRFTANELSTSHWFDLSAIRRDLGYSPKISIEEGMARLESWFTSHPEK